MADILNPATGAPVAERQEHSGEDASRAAARALQAQPAWAARSVRERATVIRQAQRWIVEYADELSRLICDCTGKPRVDAVSTEVLPGAIMCSYYARMAPRFLRPQRLRRSTLLFANKRSTLYREPYGLVGIISPWNYPLGIPLHEVIIALLCGNAVLLKVATQVQPVGDAIGSMMSAAGLPDDLLHVLHLPGRIAGDALLDAGIGKLFFTGSTAVGRELAQKAGSRLVPVSLELGGKDPMIVLEDADVERAAACAVWAGLSNAGQSCAAVERVYVHEQVYDLFMDALRPIVANLRVGYDRDFGVDMGPLTTAAQRETVESQLERSLADGGREAARSLPPRAEPAGSAERSLFHAAVVVEVDDDHAELMRSETFGPLLAVRRVASADEALSLANDSPYGLTASVWTRRPATAAAMSRRLEAGAVTVNDHLLSHGMPETPWGGVKESGIGRSHGRFGFDEMMREKVVVEERFGWIRRNMWWQPYSREVYDGLIGALRAGYGVGIRQRLAGLIRMSRLFIRRARER